MSRSKVLPLFLFAIALAFAAVQPAAAAEPASSGCGIDLAAVAQPLVETLASPALPQGETLAPAAPDFLVTFTGYCRCSCSRIKNCRTSADCGGSPCLGGITCC